MIGMVLLSGEYASIPVGERNVLKAAAQAKGQEMKWLEMHDTGLIFRVKHN
jgi:predicted metal-dependent phosphotriesterase family hydrolase